MTIGYKTCLYQRQWGDINILPQIRYNQYKIIAEGYYYVDRTDRIPLIEEAGSHLLFLRPRRFGKSLCLSTLENYYDVAKAGCFC